MLASVTIRRATPADAPAIGEVHLRSWQWAYRGLVPDAYLDRLAATLEQRIERTRVSLTDEPPEERRWVVEQAGRVVGFAITRPSGDADADPAAGEVLAIYLEPKVIGVGVGRALFTHAVDDLRQRGFSPLTLWVLESNARAWRFYEAAGWQPDGASKMEERPETLLHVVRYRAAPPLAKRSAAP